MSVPDEAVEVAARAVYGPGFDGSHHKSAWLADFRLALEAAAPFIAAQTLREASDAYPLETAYGGAEHAVLWLKERADRITE